MQKIWVFLGLKLKLRLKKTVAGKVSMIDFAQRGRPEHHTKKKQAPSAVLAGQSKAGW